MKPRWNHTKLSCAYKPQRIAELIRSGWVVPPFYPSLLDLSRSITCPEKEGSAMGMVEECQVDFNYPKSAFQFSLYNIVNKMQSWLCIRLASKCVPTAYDHRWVFFVFSIFYASILLIRQCRLVCRAR